MTDNPLITAQKVSKRIKFAKIACGILAVLGAFLFLTYRNYLDVGHIPVGILYFGIIFLTFRFLMKMKMPVSIFLIVIAGGILWMAIAKIEWNKGYLDNLTTSHGFMFEDYVYRYPRLEQYYLARLLKKPDWIRFARDCAEPALDKQPISANCRTIPAIRKTYGIQLDFEIDMFLKRMQRTALDVKSGKLKSGSAYQQCIGDKRCAPIPLLPEKVNIEEVEKDATQYADIREAFWDLADKKGLTPAVCASMVLCKVAVMTGALNFDPVPSDGS